MALAYIFTILKNVIYGSSVYFTSTLSNSVDVLDLLSLRFLMAFTVLFLLKTTGVLKIRVGVRDIFRPTERHPFVRPLLLSALFEPLLYMMLETLGITMTTGITAGVILSLPPVFSSIFEVLILKEHSSTLKKVFLGIGVVGVIYIAVNTNSSAGKDTPLGILCLVCAVVSGCLYGVFSRKSSSHFAAFEISYIASMMSATFFNSINVIRHLFKGDLIHYFDPYFDLRNLIGFVFLAIFCTVVAASMNNFALGRLPVTTTTAFGGVSTFVTITIGCVVGKERLYGFHLVGLTLILIRMIGVSWITIRAQKQKDVQQAAK
ncbi:MAG: DMT family transporter [Clostridia bacterium]|nr:DMT family transporter [Clostridia bacterium]